MMKQIEKFQNLEDQEGHYDNIDAYELDYAEELLDNDEIEARELAFLKGLEQYDDI